MYILEGNIGAGKSTLITLLGKYLPHVSLCQEPTHKWNATENGQSILTLFYEDQRRWSFTIETLAMISRVAHYMDEQKNDIDFLLMERSIFSGYYCFAKYGYQTGFLTDIEWEIYNKWFEFLLSKKAVVPQGFIYIKTDPEIAYSRIKKRDRGAEKSITLEYITSIHEYHEQFLEAKIGLSHDLSQVPVLTLDGNHEFENNIDQLEAHVTAIDSFLMANQIEAVQHHLNRNYSNTPEL